MCCEQVDIRIFREKVAGQSKVSSFEFLFYHFTNN